MKKLRSIVGILLILLSIAGLFFWEWKGREIILMEEVLVAKEEIQKGTVVSSSMFVEKGVMKEMLVEEALTQKDVEGLHGKVASQLIARNDQIILDYFRNDEFYLEKDETIFVIDPSWITMRSSSLRRGDLVDIYRTDGMGLLGSYRIAFVKDEAEREIREASDVNQKYIEKDILERTDSTSVIDHIEIITTIKEYQKILECVNGIIPSTLILVQRGDQIDT
ncbi:MAG: hypothetical protein KA282_02620 [Clostridia bacterium]|nr:hypothetical protein [Clostridia bacterium]